MAWFKETDYPNLSADNRSILVAFSNHLQKHDLALGPQDLCTILTQDDPQVDFWSVAEYIEGVEIGEVAADSDIFPQDSLSVIKFRRMDEAAAGPVDHYCAVADHHIPTIIDSLDGKIKPASAYGTPLGWATYSYTPVEPEEPEQPEEEPEPAPDPNKLYKVLSGGESPWQIASKLGLDAKELIEHNDLQLTENVTGGTILRLPVAIERPEPQPEVRYEILDEPVPMHLCKEDGATKQLFGNARRWTDIQASGSRYAKDYNVMIYAIAHVPIEGTTAAYYMERTALDESGKRVKYSVGYNHSHLDKGHIASAEVAKQTREDIQKRLEEAEATKKALEVAAAMDKAERTKKSFDIMKVEPKVMHRAMDMRAAAMPERFPTYWKSTLKPFDNPVTYIVDETFIVKEAEGRRPDRPLYKGRGVTLIGTFKDKSGAEWGLPMDHRHNGLWFKIDMNKVTPEDEVFDTNVPLVERASIKGGRLTFQERYVSVPLMRTVFKHPSIANLFNGQRQKIKEKENA